MKNKKGFTLIELLAVIVILAIVALLATPLILNIIEGARKGAFARSSENVLKASNLYYTNSILDGNMPKEISFTCDGKKCLSSKLDNEGKQINLNVDGNMGKGTVNISSKGEVDFEISNGVYCASKRIESKKIIINMGLCNETGITIEKATSTDTYKAVVYLDPINLKNKCSEREYNINLQRHLKEGNPTVTNLKTGCMRWYAYAETEETYDLILDHNAISNVAYNSNNISSEMKELGIALNELETDWEASPRLITKEEIKSITDLPYGYSFGSRYGWLIDNTKGCEKYGCNQSDDYNYIEYQGNTTSQIEGYWTSSIFSSRAVWYLSWVGVITNEKANRIVYGVRPVITIFK